MNNNNNNNSTMMMNAMKRVERLKTQVVVDYSRDDNAGGGIPMTSRLERQETFFSSPWVRVLFFFSLSLSFVTVHRKTAAFIFLSLSFFLNIRVLSSFRDAHSM